MYPDRPAQVNLKDFIIVLLIFVIGVVFILGAMSNEDLLWFLPYFNETPERITLYQSGCQVQLDNGSPVFAGLTTAINESLSQVDGYEQGFGLSPDSYKQYTDKWRALQVFYARRIKIHVPYRFGSPDSLFIPLNEYFGDARVVFGGVGGDYWAGALRLKSTASIQRAFNAIPCPP